MTVFRRLMTEEWRACNRQPLSADGAGFLIDPNQCVETRAGGGFADKISGEVGLEMSELRRALPLSLVVLYGLGVTIGAGIYVLLGAVTARAGVHAPLSFVLASIVMTFSALSYAELSTRYPVSAGEAAYVKAGLKSGKLSVFVGVLVILSGVVSSATISLGSIGYIREFVDMPPTGLLIVLVLALGAVAAWGIMESVLFASLFTLFEAGALFYIIAAGVMEQPSVVMALPKIVPGVTDGAAWAGVASAGLLAFFAFIGFEDIVNLAEEVKEPERTLPRAIFLTLIVGTSIYFLLTAVVVLIVPLDDLAASRAPLSFVFNYLTGASPVAITSIAIVATLNGVVIQIIMASRVLYGLSKQGSAPAILAFVHPRTRTPVLATAIVVGTILVLALTMPLESLAQWTSGIVLIVFALINASLVMLKRRRDPTPTAHFRVWIGVPVIGFVMSIALLAAPLLAE